MKKIEKYAFWFLFVINAGLYLYKANLPELRGDEAAPYISLVPFVQNLLKGNLFPSFLVFFHEPFHLVFQTLVVPFGLNEFWARVPNIVAGIMGPLLLWKISRLIFQKSLILRLFLMSVYIFSGFFLLFRLALNMGLFTLTMTTFIYFYFRYVQNHQNRDLLNLLVVWALSVFLFVDSLFLLPGILWLVITERNQKIWKQLMIAGGLVATGLAAWAIIIWLGSTFSHAYDFFTVAPFRLFHRGTSFSLLSPLNNFEELTSYNHILFSFGLVPLLAASACNRRARGFLALAGAPILFFNFVSKPTVHLFNFFPFMVILSAYGLEVLWPKTLRILQGALIIFIGFILFLNSIFILTKLDQISLAGYKIAATAIGDQTNTCETILTDLDGYQFRLYFGRPYVKAVNDSTQIAVLTDSPNPPGFGTEFVVIGGKIRIVKKGYSGAVREISKIGNYFGLPQLLPYLGKCSDESRFTL